jgi:catalase
VLSAEQVVDGINRRFGRHAGARALHAKGTVVRGTFTATPEGARLTRAAHMQGQPVDVTVRFSNGSGDPASPDYEPDVRGMATAFHLPDGSRTDISAQTVPHFPVRTPDEFVELVLASEPSARALWRLPLFLAKHPKVLATLRRNAAGLRPPPSFARPPYYAIHAFKWIGADGGERFVRYRWVPEASDPGISRAEAKKRGADYLQDEIRERLGRQPVRFTLEVQIAADDDRVDDPTANWPEQRERVAAGTVELTSLGTGPDEFVYDPMRLTDGIEPSADPILNFRPRAYSVSADRRMSAP